MLALEIRFLTGRYAAAEVTDRIRAEWPPHPARVFSALAAALYDDPEPSEIEVRALEWLENAGHPEIIASDAARRALGQVYVPTNDQRALADIDRYIDAVQEAETALQYAERNGRTRAEKRLKAAESRLAEQSERSAAAGGTGVPSQAAELLNRRLKPQPRPFPVAIPYDALVCMVWSADPPDGISAALDAIAARVGRLGHSSSLVSMRFLTTTNLPNVSESSRRWIPSDTGDRYLRSVTGVGHLASLRNAHQLHRQIEQRILPSAPVLYGLHSADNVKPEAPTTWFAHDTRTWIVFAVVASPEDRRRQLHDVSLAQHVARAMRGLILSKLDLHNSPPALTGHSRDGKPANQTHLAFVPLPDVRYGTDDVSRYASGAILGMALVPPADLDSGTRDMLLEAIFRAEREAAATRSQPPDSPPEPPVLRLTIGRHGIVFIQRQRGVSSLYGLNPVRWTRPSTRWLTATPIALSRNPGNLRSRDPDVVRRAVESAEGIVAAECEHIGLPTPLKVWIHRRSLVGGAPAAHRFMPFPADGNGPRRVCVHAELLFDSPVRGPVLLGAGRYFGLGLCVPGGAP